VLITPWALILLTSQSVLRRAECVMLNAWQGIIPYSHLGRIREGGRELKEGSYEESDVLRVAMPQGSV
jgi:hypothetical protein